MKKINKGSVEWEVARAFNYIDVTLLGMGDYYSEVVEWLCDLAHLEYEYGYDKNCSINEYNNKLAKNAYAIILLEDASQILSQMLDYICENHELLHRNMVWCKSSTASKHPIVKAINIIVNYVKNLVDVETYEKIKKVEDHLLNTNTDICSLGRTLGHEFYQYLDNKYYLRTNDIFTVGYLTYNGDNEHELGEYVFHASLRTPNNEGYTIALKKENKKIIVKFYEYKSFYRTHTMEHKDLDCTIVVTKANKEKLAKLIAEKINEYTREKGLDIK